MGSERPRVKMIPVTADHLVMYHGGATVSVRGLMVTGDARTPLAPNRTVAVTNIVYVIPGKQLDRSKGGKPRSLGMEGLADEAGTHLPAPPPPLAH